MRKRPLDPALRRLADVLASDNPTRGHLELSLHIDRIACFSDGKVVVRTCKLGALSGAAELLADTKTQALPPAETADDGTHKARPRRRQRLRVTGSMAEANDLDAAVTAATQVDRFKGLDDSWFWNDVFQTPGRTCWSDAHAEDVYRLRQATGDSLEKLAAHFGASVPTIRKALCVAQARRDASSSHDVSMDEP